MNEGEDVVGSAFLVFRFPLKLEGSFSPSMAFLFLSVVLIFKVINHCVCRQS